MQLDHSLHRSENRCDGGPTSTSDHVEPMDISPPEEDDWTNDVYARLNGVRHRTILPGVPCAERWPVTRILTAVFSLFLLLCGLTLFLVSSAIHAQRLTDQFYITFCKSCSSIATVGAFLGAFVAILGILGLRSTARARQLSCTSVVFAVALSVIALLLIVSAGYVAHAQCAGTSRERIQSLWLELVKRRPPLVCDLESTLQCSGLSGGRCCIFAPLESPTSEPSACFLVGGNATSPAYFDPMSKVPVEWPAVVCPLNCQRSDPVFTEACDDVLEAALFASYQRLLIGLLIGSAITALFSFFAFLHLWKKPALQQPPAYIQYEY